MSSKIKFGEILKTNRLRVQGLLISGTDIAKEFNTFPNHVELLLQISQCNFLFTYKTDRKITYQNITFQFGFIPSATLFLMIS